MCTVSMIGDHYRDRWFPQPQPFAPTGPSPFLYVQPVTRAEFDELKRDVQEMKELLKRAKQYDIEHGEPDCEMDEKMEVLRRVAELVGIDLDDVLGPVA